MIAILALLLQEASEPHIGYCYPAGAKQGTTVRCMIGGQLLNGPKDVLVSGTGVKATIVRYLGRIVRFNGEERREIIRRLKKQPPNESVKLPNHPIIKDLDQLSQLEIDFLMNEFLKLDPKKQPNMQLAETVLIEVTVDAAAPVGTREIRLRGQLGLTNPMVFQVGDVAEMNEPSPYDENAVPAPAVDLPVTINGQIKPGDSDRFRFRAKQGQQLVLQAQARKLIPFIADAVPGWFQSAIAIFDAQGKEVAYADDYRFEPDPVLYYKIPATGEYEIEIHDALYRGREDFVYRIQISEQPFAKSIFPLGGRAGEPLTVAVEGWNLREKRMTLDTGPGEPIRTVRGVTYAVDALPDCFEVENGSPQRVELPIIVNGRISKPGDEDVFQFSAKAGEEIVAEVQARRLQSPLDSLVQLLDANGKILAWNDDYEKKEGDLRPDMGAITHHADSYLRARLPENGVYRIRLTDAQQQGGEGYAYRLRLSAPRPDFSLRMTPSTLNVRVATAITIHVLRTDGFDGAITISAREAGLKIHGATIPAGCDRIRMTIASDPLAQPTTLHLEGRAGTDVRTVVACEDSMQAFLWRHLVPSQELVALTLGQSGRGFETPAAVRIPRGGTAEVLFRLPPRQKLDGIEFDLDEAPKGVTLVSATVGKDGLKIVLKADDVAAGTSGNLIVGIYTQPKDKQARKRRFGVGVLPAIPFTVVR